MTCVYLANWENRFTMSPFEEDEGSFMRIGPLVLLEVSATRTVRLVPSAAGNVPHTIERSKNAGLGLQYRWKLIGPCVNFRRHFVEMQILEGDVLHWQRPPDHELPWPDFINIGPDTRDTIMLREFARRVKSCVETDGERTDLERLCADTPTIVKRTIPDAIWGHIIQTGGELPCM